MSVRVAVDYEYNAEEWWEAARAHPDPPHGIRPLLALGGPGSVVVTEAEADRIRRWAASLPGWGGGPDYAPDPILFHDEEDEDEDAVDASETL